MTKRQEFFSAFKTVLPMAVGIVPFGLIVGITAEPVVGSAHAVFMSAVIVAGASQLSTIQLLTDGATWIIILMTAMVINVRFLLYSASLEPHLRRTTRIARFAMSFFLVDQIYALSLSSFTNHPNRRHAAWYYWGLVTPVFTVWMSSSVMGVVLGARVPDSWGLGFAVPLVFIALVFPAITDKATRASALVAAIVGILAFSLPFNLFLPVAALSGIAVGMSVEARNA